MLPCLVLLALFGVALAGDRCGSAANGASCIGSGYGNCCSSYNYWYVNTFLLFHSFNNRLTYDSGSSNAYCGAGCQAAFGQCGSSRPSSSSSKVISSSTHMATPSPTSLVSKNARCGSNFGSQTCKGSNYGNCCSQYSYVSEVQLYGWHSEFIAY